MTIAEIDALPDMTPAQELKLVNKAINDILSGGQRYSINERQMEKAKLEALFERKDKLTDLVAAETSDSGGILLGGFGEPF